MMQASRPPDVATERPKIWPNTPFFTILFSNLLSRISVNICFSNIKRCHIFLFGEGPQRTFKKIIIYLPNLHGYF